MFVRFTDKEKKMLKETALRFGFNVSEYVRRKLFDENEDIIEDTKFISPYNDKHNLVNISVLYKTFYLVKEILKNQKVVDPDSIIEAEKKALEYAKLEREKYGYKLVKLNDG